MTAILPFCVVDVGYERILKRFGSITGIFQHAIRKSEFARFPKRKGETENSMTMKLK